MKQLCSFEPYPNKESGLKDLLRCPAELLYLVMVNGTRWATEQVSAREIIGKRFWSLATEGQPIGRLRSTIS